MEINATDYNYYVDDIIDIGDITLYGVKNVISYSFINYNTWKINTHNNNDNSVKTTYLIIDTQYNDAFGHWIFESSLYIPLYHELKKRFSNVKIVIDKDLSYKRHMLDYFNVPHDDIALTIDSNNICYFPKPITALNDNVMTDTYKNHITRLFDTLHSTSVEKTIDILLLPRQKKENYIHNDRITDTTDIENRLSELSNNTHVLHTDNNVEMRSQIELVQRAKIIIVTDGSPFCVNGFFAKDSKIILLGDIGNRHIPLFCKFAFLMNIIDQNNTVFRIPFSAVGGSYHHSVFKLEHILPYL